MAKAQLKQQQFTTAELRTMSVVALLIHTFTDDTQRAALDVMQLVMTIGTAEQVDAITTALALLEKHEDGRRIAMLDYLAEASALVDLQQHPVM